MSTNDESDHPGTEPSRRGMSTPTRRHPTDPIFAALADYKRAFRHANVLYDALQAAEAKARREIGPSPWTLIGWRRYSDIGGAEIDRAFAEFLQSPDADQDAIRAEYEDAKARERAAKSELCDWYRRAGLDALEREYRATRAAEQRALMALARSKPRTPVGAAAFLAFVRKDMKIGDHKWQGIALGTIAETLKSWGDAVAA